MGRIHGRRGRVYLGIADENAAATPLPFVATWSINFPSPKEKVTALEDNNETYVAGVPDASGEFGGFYDDSSAQTYTAARDGLPRKFYLYPNRLVAVTYFHGLILPDQSLTGGVTSPVQMSASWAAASDIIKVAP